VTEPELTTIAQPIYDMGALAARLLIKEIEGLVVEKKVYEFPVTLIPRKSSQKEVII
jgi:LacI family transcriptional regulator